MNWKLGIQTNAWGNVVGHPVGVTSIKDLFYTSGGISERILDDICDAGYTGIEVFDGDLLPFRNDLGRFKRLLSDRGLSLVGVYSGANFIYPDILEEEFWRLGIAAKLAADAGAEQFVVGGGAVRSTGTTDGDFMRLADGLERVVKLAEAHNLIPTFHPHLGTMVETPLALERVMRHSTIGFCPDVAHLAAGGGDPAALIRLYASRMPYVHLKDYRPDPFEFLPLGEGELDLLSIIRALEEVDYSGWIVVEFDGYSGDAKGGAIASKKFLEASRSLK